MHGCHNWHKFGYYFTSDYFFVCSIYLFYIQEYQKHMEAFDQKVANVTTWIYRAEILLDESDKQKPQQKEETLKVKKKCDFLENINFILKRNVAELAYFGRYPKLINIIFSVIKLPSGSL